jgi:hypothetical protein
MSRIRESIELIENATAGQRAIVRPQLGRTILDAHIEHGGLTLAQMTNIKVLLVSATRTVTLMEYKDGEELNKLNKRYFRNTEAGTLSFYFRRPELQSEVERMSTALGTGGLQQVKIEFDIAPDTTPVVKAFGKFTANRDVAAGLLTYIVPSNTGGNATGENHKDDIDRRDRIAAIHVLNNAVDHLDLRINGTTAFDLDRARTEFDELGSSQGRQPYDDDYGLCMDFLLSGVLDETLMMDSPQYPVNSMRLTATLGDDANSQVRYLVEYLSTWSSLNA